MHVHIYYKNSYFSCFIQKFSHFWWIVEGETHACFVVLCYGNNLFQIWSLEIFSSRAWGGGQFDPHFLTAPGGLLGHNSFNFNHYTVQGEDKWLSRKKLGQYLETFPKYYNFCRPRNIAKLSFNFNYNLVESWDSINFIFNPHPPAGKV